MYLFLGGAVCGICANSPPGSDYRANEGKQMRFSANRQYREASAEAIIPIWVNNELKPVIVRIISGKTELLLEMGII